MCLCISPRTYRRYRQKARQQKKRVYYKLYEIVGKKLLSPMRSVSIPIGKSEVVSNREENNLPKNKVYPRSEQKYSIRSYDIGHAIHVYQNIEIAKKTALVSDILIPVIGYSKDFIAGNSKEAALNKIYIESKTWKKIKRLLKINCLDPENRRKVQFKTCPSFYPHLWIDEDGYIMRNKN